MLFVVGNFFFRRFSHGIATFVRIIDISARGFTTFYRIALFSPSFLLGTFVIITNIINRITSSCLRRTSFQAWRNSPSLRRVVDTNSVRIRDVHPRKIICSTRGGFQSSNDTPIT